MDNLLAEVGRLLIEAEIEGFKAVSRAISQAKADRLQFGDSYCSDWWYEYEPKRGKQTAKQRRAAEKAD
jgi:hypothetical protein